MDTERIIGADIMMAFDECPPGQSDYQYAKKSLMLTQRWLDRCIKRFNETEPLYGYEQTLFPIVQGCTFKDLRRDAAKFVADKGADGNAIGGLAVGEPTEVMYEMIEVVNEILPKDKPRYLMGVGTPQIFWKPSNAELTCLIVSCRQETAGTPCCLHIMVQ